MPHIVLTEEQARIVAEAKNGVEVRDPGLQTSLYLFYAVPAVPGGVRVDPGAWVASGLAHGSSHRHGQASQLRHAAARLPLGLPSDITIQPEAVFPQGNDFESLVELLRRDQIPAMG